MVSKVDWNFKKNFIFQYYIGGYPILNNALDFSQEL